MQDAKETLEGRFGLENLIGRPSAEAKSKLALLGFG